MQKCRIAYKRRLRIVFELDSITKNMMQKRKAIKFRLRDSRMVGEWVAECILKHNG